MQEYWPNSITILFLHLINVIFLSTYSTTFRVMCFCHTMSTMLHALRILMFVAGSCLVANDVARVLFPGIQQALIAQICDDKDKDDNNTVSAFSFFEEEVKHSGKDRYFLPLEAGELETAAAHLIQDDNVRHLAYIPIFSPPPNRA